MKDRSRLRLLILGVLVFSLPVTLLGRLWYMQALAGAQYAAAVTQNALSTIKTVAPRGLITDDMGRPLATNASALVVSALSTALPKANLGTKDHPKANPAREQELQRLSAVLGVSETDLDAKTTLCDYHDYGSKAPQVDPGCWTGSPLQPIPLVTIDNSTPQSIQHATQVALQVLEQKEDFPGITAQVQAVRNYPAPDNASAAQLIGHVGKITADTINAAKTDADKQTLTEEAGVGAMMGQAGLEAEYNSYLQGTMGTRTMSVSPAGTPLGTVSEVPAVPGDEVVTSIDARVQAIAEQALADAVNHARTVPQLTGNHQMLTVPADAAAAVVIDARTGHVVAAANYPTYDPNVWNGGTIDAKVYDQLLHEPGSPLFSQAVQGQYAPGSTFKVVTTAGAVSTPYYSLSGAYECPAVYKAGGRTFTNFEGETGQGNISFAQALITSCDTFFYSIGDTLWKADGGINAKNPKDVLINEAKAFGFGKPTDVDLPIDASGSILTRQDKVDAWNKNKGVWCAQWQTEKDPYISAIEHDNCLDGNKYQEGDALNFAIGQGTTTVSPLQLADAYAAIGNGGTLFTPRIAKAIVGPDGKLVKTITAPSTKLPVPANVLSYEQEALSHITTDPAGTASAAFTGFPTDKYTVSGKTGTAEVQGKSPTAVFASYGGPAGQPAQYAVVVMVSQGAQGGITAAPAVREIYDGIYGLDGAGGLQLPHDHYAAAGPALPNSAPPAQLPNLAPPSASASPAPSNAGNHGGSTPPSALAPTPAGSAKPTTGPGAKALGADVVPLLSTVAAPQAVATGPPDRAGRRGGRSP